MTLFQAPTRWSAAASAFAFSLLAFGHQTASAGPVILFDVADGRVLYAEDQDHLWHPASLTKIMTAYLAFEAIKAGKIAKDTKLVVSELANGQAPSKIGLPVGGTMTVELAIQALIIKSANDVAVMLAEGISGSVEAFASDMNKAAKRLGMTKTTFVNPNGLPAAEQVTTARDLAKLSRAVMREYPDHAALWAQADMRIGRIRLRSHNGLLKTYDGADGLKTGFTCDSGYNVVATATRDGRKVAAVVLGEASGRDRNLRAAGLLEHGFETSGWRAALQQTATIDTMPAAADATATPTSVRASVMTWDCGNRRRRANPAVAKVKQQRKQLTTATAGATAGTPGTPSAATPPATAQPGSVPPAPQPKAKKPPAAAQKQAQPAPATKTE